MAGPVPPMFATSPATPTLNGWPERAWTMAFSDQLPTIHAAGPFASQRLPVPTGRSHTVYHERKCGMSKPDGPSFDRGSKKFCTDDREPAPSSTPKYPLVLSIDFDQVYDTSVCSPL